MRPKYSRFGGCYAALVVLAVAAFAAAPSFAQKESTPEEQAATAALNRTAAAGTSASAEQLNGEDPGFNFPAYRASESQGTAPPVVAQREQEEQYQNEQQNYRRAQDDYEDQQLDYQAQQGRYDEDRNSYEAATAGLTDLSDLDNPEDDLVNARVYADGKSAGQVRGIEMADNGDVLSVEIAVTPNHVVWVDAADLLYDDDTRTVVTSLSYDQLWDMPRTRG